MGVITVISGLVTGEAPMFMTPDDWQQRLMPRPEAQLQLLICLNRDFYKLIPSSFVEFLTAIESRLETFNGDGLEAPDLTWDESQS
eukprot:29580-Amphidinium_carterae.1